jgi:hypothetical protein
MGREERGGAVPRTGGDGGGVPLRIRVVERVTGALVHLDFDVRCRARRDPELAEIREG